MPWAICSSDAISAVFLAILNRRSNVSGVAASDRIVAFAAYPVMNKTLGTDRRRYTPSIISRIFAAR